MASLPIADNILTGLAFTALPCPCTTELWEKIYP
jgi:hypothetical protein